MFLLIGGRPQFISEIFYEKSLDAQFVSVRIILPESISRALIMSGPTILVFCLRLTAFFVSSKFRSYLSIPPAIFNGAHRWTSNFNSPSILTPVQIICSCPMFFGIILPVRLGFQMIAMTYRFFCVSSPTLVLGVTEVPYSPGLPSARISILQQWWPTFGPSNPPRIHCLSTFGGERVPRPFVRLIHGTVANSVLQFYYIETVPSDPEDKYILMLRNDRSGYKWFLPSRILLPRTLQGLL